MTNFEKWKNTLKVKDHIKSMKGTCDECPLYNKCDLEGSCWEQLEEWSESEAE